MLFQKLICVDIGAKVTIIAMIFKQSDPNRQLFLLAQKSSIV